MIVLAICNHKGGTGKTTSTINLAAALGLSGYRTLVVDLDPQSFLTRMVGLPEPPVEASSLMLFDPERSLRDLPVQKLSAFDVLPSSSMLSKAMRRLNKPTDVFWVKEAIEEAPDEYDAILFDTAAAITVFSLNALVASRHVLIPVMPEYQPVLGAEQTFQTAMMVREKLNPTLGVPQFMFTMVDARKRNHHAYRRYLRGRYGDRVMNAIIRTSASLSVTHNDGSTVFEHAPQSRGARDYANAADELLGLIAPERREEQPRVTPEAPARGPWKSITHLG